MMKKLASVAVAGLVMFTAVPAAPASDVTRAWSCLDYKRSEKSFVRKMNNARTNRGVNGFRIDRQLSKVARRHTAAMVAGSELFHTPSTTLANRVTSWTVLGENVGVGNTVDSLHRAFMKSPAHKANVLFGSFRHVGVGTRRDGDRLWVTVVFEAKTDPGTTLKPPVC